MAITRKNQIIRDLLQDYLMESKLSTFKEGGDLLMSFLAGLTLMKNYPEIGAHFSELVPGPFPDGEFRRMIDTAQATVQIESN